MHDSIIPKEMRFGWIEEDGKWTFIPKIRHMRNRIQYLADHFGAKVEMRTDQIIVDDSNVREREIDNWRSAFIQEADIYKDLVSVEIDEDIVMQDGRESPNIDEI